MPRIFDNIEQDLLVALQETMERADHADFCVGYFNLRGWKKLDHFVEAWSGGEGHCCRLLVGMHRAPADELRAAMGMAHGNGEIDNQTAARLKKRLAEEFREQLAIGAPTNEDETCLRRLAPVSLTHRGHGPLPLRSLERGGICERYAAVLVGTRLLGCDQERYCLEQREGRIEEEQRFGPL